MQIAQQHGLYTRARSADEVVDRMRRDIRIELVEDRDRRGREQRSFLFTVAYTAVDPVVAARVANTLASLYIEENGRMREAQAAGATEFLDTQLRELRERLQRQEGQITAYKEKHLGELPEQKEVNLRTLERLQQQLQLAHENNRRASERRQMLTNALGEIDTTASMTSAPSLAGPTVTPADTAAARLNLLRQELAMTQTRFSDKYPDVIQLKEQIRALEAKVDAEKAAAAALPKAVAGPKKGGRDLRLPPENPYVQSLMTQLDQATVEAKTSAEEIRGINAQIAVYQRRLENTPKREQELAVLMRDYDSNKELHRSLLAKRGEADMASELEQRQKGEHFRVIEQARLPERPAGPNRFRLLLVGLALALGAGAAAVVLAEQVDTSFRRVDEVRSALPLPVLSAIPRITTEQDRTRRLRQRRWATAAVAAGLLVVGGTSFMVAHDNQRLVAMLTSPSQAAMASPTGR
jgi:polysaccharide chain length determinant protein (PEP-CTERM system associated)